MSMKLSRRDKVIILVVIVLVVIGAGILVLLKPKYEEVQQSEDRLTAKEAELAEVEARIATLEDLKKTLKNNVDTVVKEQQEFISDDEVQDTQQISSYLMKLLEPAGLTITGVKITNMGSAPLVAYTYNKKAVAYPMKIYADLAHQLPEEVYYAYNGSYPAVPPTVPIGQNTVTISWEADLDCHQLFDSADILADSEKNVYLKTLSAELALDNDKEPVSKGELVIDFYTIHYMDPADVDKEVPSAS